MTFQPIVPASGIVGWKLLQKTYDNQFAAFSKSPQLERDTTYFMENIKEITSAEQLVKDRRMLSVALGAFGLQDDINNRFLIQRVLEDGTLDNDSLANRLSDERYKKLSEAFGFGPGEIQRTGVTDWMQDVVDKFWVQSFEVAVGEQDDAMRIALFGQRELPILAESDQSENAKWFSILGQPPLRAMFETALGLPAQVGQVDIDQQVEIFKDRAQSVLGTSDVAEMNDPELIERLTNLYLARDLAASFNATTGSASIALQLLGGA